MTEQEKSEKLKQELRRGALVLAVLCQLKQEHYGYSLRKKLEKHGLNIDESTLYPLVRRLESQGLLTSEWRDDGKRKKRFYQISELGTQTVQVLMNDWDQMNNSIKRIQEENQQ